MCSEVAATVGAAVAAGIDVAGTAVGSDPPPQAAKIITETAVNRITAGTPDKRGA